MRFRIPGGYFFLATNQSLYYQDKDDNYPSSRRDEGSSWYCWWHLMILIVLPADRLVLVTGHCVSSLHHVLVSQYQQTDWSVSQPPGDWRAELAVRWNVLEDVQCQLSLVYSGLYISTRTSHHPTHDQAAAGLNGKHSATPHWDMLCWNTALDHSCILLIIYLVTAKRTGLTKLRPGLGRIYIWSKWPPRTSSSINILTILSLSLSK